MKLLLFVVFFGLLNLNSCFEPKVTLKLGKISGLSESINGKDVNVFLGIPFAKKPVNELRFRKPQPLIEKWSTDIKANKWPNACIQMELNSMYLAPQSEDCLYLNIWTPVGLESDFKSDLRPVIVFFHGGGFIRGSASLTSYNSSLLSTVGDVIVVTVNYRLGALGFMYGGSDEMPGNMGLYDQALALEWVQENIAYFGGDKDLVTILGQSAGSMSAAFHLMSPVSQNLFKYAVAMSGVATNYPFSSSIEQAKNARNRVGKQFSCQISNEETVTQSTLKCLRDIDAGQFAFGKNDEIGFNSFEFGPIYGEKFLPKESREMWNQRLFKRRTSLLIGSVPNEGICFHLFNHSIFRSGLSAEQIFRDHWANAMMYTNKVVDIDEIIKFYFDGVNEEKKIDQYLLALSDLYFNCPINQFAAHFSSENQVYQYLLDFESEFKMIQMMTNGCKQCESKRLTHIEDVQFAFGTTVTEHDNQLSLQLIKIITHFARTGKANWPAYYKTKNNELVSKFHHIKNTEKESEIDEGYRATACQLWWRMLFN